MVAAGLAHGLGDVGQSIFFSTSCLSASAAAAMRLALRGRPIAQTNS
jgi:hypothetical protein